MNHIDRRTFLAGLGGSIALGPLARASRLVSTEAGPRTLVLMQLSGGNDGLSTVVPYADDAYGRARRATRQREQSLHRIDDYRGLHGELVRMSAEYEEGRLAIIEGVGYPEMVRSHFKALEIWHTANGRGRASGDGWIGRLAATAWAKEDHPELIVHLGSQVPWSVHSRSHPPVAMGSPTGYRWFGNDGEQEAYGMAGEALNSGEVGSDSANTGRDAALSRLRGVLDDARTSSRKIRSAAATYTPSAEYPREPLAATLRDVAAMIHGGLGSRVISVLSGGFDTHAGQRGDHDGLMRGLDASLGAFVSDLSHSDEGRSTLVLVFSEFGRRVKENASEGTDHGKAGPAFMLGSAVKGGLYGSHPSLTDLDGGDLAWNVDFRSLYGEVIEGWFGTPMEQVLGKRYPRLGVVK